MHLSRCRDQHSKTLDEFYEDIRDREPPGSRLGSAMLSLLARLRALPDDRRVYGLTSHYHLQLLAKDASDSNWFVSVVGNGRYYIIEYVIPERHAPFPRAHMCGEARSEDQAVEMILIAMEKSEGWKQVEGS
jgi:hypothetical protein